MIHTLNVHLGVGIILWIDFAYNKLLLSHGRIFTYRMLSWNLVLKVGYGVVNFVFTKWIVKRAVYEGVTYNNWLTIGYCIAALITQTGAFFFFRYIEKQRFEEKIAKYRAKRGKEDKISRAKEG